MDIIHKVGIKGSTTDRVYHALTTLEGLCGWWTSTTTGEGGKVGGVLHFRFGSKTTDMRVIELEAGQRVVWEVLDETGEWRGTKIVFDLKQKQNDAIVLFAHQGWREPTDMMHHCSTKWGTFMMSLKSLLEHGKGAPFPNDVHIE